MSDSENEEYVNNVIDDEEEEIEEKSNKIEIKKNQVKDENINKIENNNIKKGNLEKVEENEEENNNIKNLNKNNSNYNNQKDNQFGVDKVNENNEEEFNENKKIEKENEHIETYPDDIDPNVKQLIDLDFKKADKNKIAELLLNDNLLSTKQQDENITNPNQNKINNTNSQNNKISTIKKDNKYKNINSTIKNYISGPTNKRNYHYYDYLNNPELTSDFKSATIKVISKLSENEKNSEVMKILFPKGLKTIKQNNKTDFNDKINQALIKKQEDLERIATKCNDEYNKKHTFNPIINKNNNEKRSLRQFLKDEESHLKKMKDDIERIKLDNEKKIQKNATLIPKINKKSDKILSKVNSNNENVYNRLYNRRNQSAIKGLIENNELNVIEIKKKDFKKREISVTRPKTVVREKPIPKKFLLLDKDLITNKIFLKFFKDNFNQVSKDYFEKLNEDDDAVIENDNELNYVDDNEINEINNLNNDDKKVEEEKNKENKEEENKKDEDKKEEIKEEEKKEEEKKEEIKNEENKEEEKKENEVKNNNKLNLTQLYEFLYELGMCSKPIPETNSESNPIVEGALQQKEKKLVTILFNSLKNEEDMIEIEHLFKFLISVLGLNYYDLYKEFKKTHEESEVNLIMNENKPKNDKIDFIINKQNNENESKIDNENKRNNKYISFDKDNQLIIPISKSKIIKKDFQLFSINYMSKTKNKKSKDKIKEEEYSFKPNINKKSEKLYEDIIINLKDIDDKNLNDNNENINHKEFIERLYKQNNKKLAQYEKMREELEKKELENCTFKPKTNNFSSITKARGANRFNELFHKGSQKEKNRKNKTQEEFEFEKYGSECTFKPNIKNKKVNKKSNFKNDIYNEKSYKLLYDRLKKGRIERLIKENANDRFGYDEILKDYIKKNKEREFDDKDDESNDDENNSEEDNNDNNNNENGNNKNNDTKDKKNKDNDDEKEEEKKEGIPLLIIDVNIRQGVKKKIYVYEGDTPEGLAKKFATEHNLEHETQEKLQNLIHNHMLRLLTRIDEENQSLSEKAQ